MDCLEKRKYKMSAINNEHKKIFTDTTVICIDSFDGHFKAIENVSNEHPDWTGIMEIKNELLDIVL